MPIRKYANVPMTQSEALVGHIVATLCAIGTLAHFLIGTLILHIY